MQRAPAHPLDATVDPAPCGDDDADQVGEALRLHGLLELPGEGALHGVERTPPQRCHAPSLRNRIVTPATRLPAGSDGYSPRRNHSSYDGASAPTVVSSPCPVSTRVSGGSAKRRRRMESRIVG